LSDPSAKVFESSVVVGIAILNDSLGLHSRFEGRCVKKRSLGSAHHFRPTYALANVGHPSDFLVDPGIGGADAA
jgi:hypothetical protein